MVSKLIKCPANATQALDTTCSCSFFLIDVSVCDCLPCLHHICGFLATPWFDPSTSYGHFVPIESYHRVLPLLPPMVYASNMILTTPRSCATTTSHGFIPRSKKDEHWLMWWALMAWDPHLYRDEHMVFPYQNHWWPSQWMITYLSLSTRFLTTCVAFCQVHEHTSEVGDLHAITSFITNSISLGRLICGNFLPITILLENWQEPNITKRASHL
jgi:hypothetical protein